MFKLAVYFLVLFILHGVYGLRFEGKFVGVPEEALDSQARDLKSPVLNGLNYQARITVRLVKIEATNDLNVQTYPVRPNFSFEVDNITEGEYELMINSYDFNIRNSRFKLDVDQSQIRIQEYYLAADSFNSTSVQILTKSDPLVLEILDYKHYYQSAQSKLSEMIMNSPFGIVFQNRLYTILAAVTLAMMIGPPLVSTFLPEVAERFNELQREAYEMKVEKEASGRSEIEADLIPKTSGTKTSGRSGKRN